MMIRYELEQTHLDRLRSISCLYPEESTPGLIDLVLSLAEHSVKETLYGRWVCSISPEAVEALHILGQDVLLPEELKRLRKKVADQPPVDWSTENEDPPPREVRL